MSIQLAIKKARLENLVNGQERVLEILNDITQNQADMDVLEFIDMYLHTKKDLALCNDEIFRAEFKVVKKREIGNIESNFQEDMINDMFNDMDSESEY